MNPLKDPEDLGEATQLINAYARNDWVKFTYSSHALQRQGERIIPNDLVELALRTGSAVSVKKEVRKGRLCYAYEVKMIDQYGHVTVITAIAGPMHLVIVSTYTNISD